MKKILPLVIIISLIGCSSEKKFEQLEKARNLYTADKQSYQTDYSNTEIKPIKITKLFPDEEVMKSEYKIYKQITEDSGILLYKSKLSEDYSTMIIYKDGLSYMKNSPYANRMFNNRDIQMSYPLK